MPDNRLTLTISAQNLAGQAFKELQADVRRSNEHLEQIAKNTQKVTRETVKLTASQQIVRRLRNEYNLLRTEVANTAAVSRQFAGALQSQVRAQFDAAASLERLHVSLVIISGSAAAAAEQYQRLLEAARLPGINLQNSLRASLQLQAIGKSGQEATNIIKEFGNAFALAGGSGQQLSGVVHGIRQIISDGTVLQRELNIITSRIAILTPIMQEAFGGNRAEDVRAFAESIGRGDDVVGVFFETVLAGLKELPRAGNTAANAIENLGDSYERAQAAIGGNFLPIVKEATAALEGVFMVVERDPQLARTIAVFEGLAGTFLTVTAAGVGLAAALPAITAAVASLGAPILLPIAGVAALTAGFVALTVASQDVETRIEKLAATFDELDTALRANHEAIQSNQQAQVESAKSSLTAQRTAIRQHITLLGEEIAAIERSIAANQLRAERGLLPIASTGESFGTQLDKANARLEVTRQKLQEINDALRANEKAAVPIQKATVNIETLTKAVTQLKAELEEETTFEGISQSVTGDPAGFRRSAQALTDIETLVRVNVDRFKELGDAAASGNQEAVKGLSAVNKELNTLRDAAADRHIDNLSTAFENLTKTTDPSRKQLEAILKSADAFVQTFQGGADVVQDDVARALGLISQVREQLQALSGDELRLETHDIGAQGLTEALLRFDDLQSTVQEDAGIDAQRSAEKQATAYIKAYRDSVDPAILNVVESVKVLRTELRGSIQDLEALNLRDKFTLEFQGEIGGERSEALAELFDLNQAVQDGIRENEIANLRKRSLALREKLADDTLSLQQYQTDVIAILRSVYDAERAFQAVDVREDLNKRQAENARKLSQTILALEDTTKEGQIERILDTAQERQRVLAGSEGALKVIYDRFVQLEQDSQDKLAGIILGGKVADARKELTRLEERALDISSKRQRENLIRETAQYVDAYAERGEAFRDLVVDAQDLGSELQQAFDLTEQQKRIEDFQDSVAGVLDNLAGIAIDHIFDSFTDGADSATEAFGIFTDRVRGDFELLENDVNRLDRQVEDFTIRLSRIGEDEERRVRQLERQRRALLARASTGNQRDAERTRQRSQDISFKIANLREDFDVRRQRTQEDADRRRNRSIEDAVGRRERFESRQTGESLPRQLLVTLGDSVADKLSNALSGALAGLITGALASPFQSLIDGIKGIFGGGGDGDGDDGEATTNVTGTLTIPEENITLPESALALQGVIMLATTDITAPTDATSLMGIIGEVELQEDAKTPSVPGLKGGLIDIVLQQNVSKPIVPGLFGEIGTVTLNESLILPTITLDGIINATVSTPALPEGIVEVGPLEVVGPPDTPVSPTAPPATTAPTDPIDLTGMIALALTDITAPTDAIDLKGAIALMATDIAVPEGSVALKGAITLAATDIIAPATATDLQGIINASLNKTFTEPIALAGIINATVSTPALPEGMVEVGELEVIGPPDDTSPTTPTPSALQGVINAELNKTFTEPIALAGIINATVNAPALRDGMVEVGPLEVIGGGGRQRGTDGEDPENPQLNIDDLEGEIDSLKISEEAKALIEPVLLQGEIQATLVKLFTEPILLDGIINARVNYLTGANKAPGGGEGGDGGGTSGNATTDLTNSITTLGQKLDSITADPAPDASVPSLQPTGGAVATRGGGGGGNAIQVTFPPSLRSAITSQANTLLELQSAQKEFFQSSVAFYNKTGNQNLTANQHLSGIRRVLAGETEDNETLNRLATEATLTSISDTLNQIHVETQRVADAPLVQGLIDAGVAFPNDPQDPTNAAFTQSPIQDILSQGGLSLFAGFDAINQNLQTLLEGQAEGTPDLSVMPGGDPSTPMYAHIVNQPPVQDVRVVNDVRTKTEITNKVKAQVEGTVNVKQVGVVQVTQSGEWVMQLASGSTIPVYVQGGHVTADLAGGLEGLAIALADEEVRLSAVGGV